MPLNKARGNMFNFITHTWNPIKGACFHDCTYCYMKKWGELKPAHFVKSEMKTDLEQYHFIFIGSSIDIFGQNINYNWINDILCKAIGYNNMYLLQSKNPERFLYHLDDVIPSKFVFSTTIETNYFYPNIMKNSPTPYIRARDFSKLHKDYRRMVTIEPVMQFDLAELVAMVMSVNPEQINIGADSLNKGLPEPTGKQILKLIEILERYTRVEKKPNLSRLLKQA